VTTVAPRIFFSERDLLQFREHNTQFIAAGRPNWSCLMLDELKPLWDVDFSILPKLEIPESTRNIFPFDPPTVPFKADNLLQTGNFEGTMAN